MPPGAGVVGRARARGRGAAPPLKGRLVEPMRPLVINLQVNAGAVAKYCDAVEMTEQDDGLR